MENENNPTKSTSPKPRPRTRVTRRQRLLPQVTVNIPSTSTASAHTWKDSRLVIAALTALGTATFWHSVIFPLYDVTQKTELTTYRAEAEKIPALTKKVKNMEERLWHAENANAFDSSSAYPDGFKLVRIGDSADKLTSAFEATSVNKDKASYWTVKNQHSIFERVTYYFDHKKKNRPVTHLAFDVNFSQEDDYLSVSIFDEDNAKKLTRRLIDTYGEPKFDNDKK